MSLRLAGLHAGRLHEEVHQQPFPRRDIDCPDHRRLAHVATRPHAAVSFIATDVQTIHHRQPEGQIAGRLDLKRMLRLTADNGWLQRNRHRHRIGERDADLTGLNSVGFHGSAIAIDTKISKRRHDRADGGDVGLQQIGVASAQMPANHLDRQPAVKDPPSGFGVDPDVVLRRRRDISLATGIATHDDATSDQFRD